MSDGRMHSVKSRRCRLLPLLLSLLQQRCLHMDPPPDRAPTVLHAAAAAPLVCCPVLLLRLWLHPLLLMPLHWRLEVGQCPHHHQQQRPRLLLLLLLVQAPQCAALLP
jgi:hypothetical protein